MAHLRLLQRASLSSPSSSSYLRIPPVLIPQIHTRHPAARTRLVLATQLPCAAIRQYSDQNKNKGQNKNQNPNQGRTFREELSVGIQSRLERERRERSQAAYALEKSQPRRRWALTFSLIFTSVVSYVLGTYRPWEPDPASTLPLNSADAPQHNTKRENMMGAWADLVAIVGEEHVSTDEPDLAHHASSSWSSHPQDPDHKSFCIVYPETTEQVSEIMKVCHRRKIPVTAFSGGTSIEGGYVPTRGGVCVAFTRMGSVVELHKDDLDVVVQPAVTWETLNHHLAPHGLFFPPDPGPGAMIGGMVGTGCSGTNAHRWGTMREWVLGLTVVLADGTVIRTRQRPRKSSAGYDLTRLFIGSEGTLGLVTEATLKLAVVPPHTSIAVASFPSIRAAAACAADVVAKGVAVAAVELLDDAQMACVNAAGTTSRAWDEAPTLFFKFGAQSERGVREQVDAAKDAARRAGAKKFEFAKRGGDEAVELWSARKEALWSAMAAGKELGRERVWTGDVAVPVGRLADIVEETKEEMGREGLFGTIVGHVGDGNFHVIMVYNDEERPRVESLMHNMVKRAIEMEGTVTGEHGVGLVKRDYLEHELGKETVDMMRKIKKAFDPLCLLNCDKVIRMQRPQEGEVKSWK